MRSVSAASSGCQDEAQLAVREDVRAIGERDRPLCALLDEEHRRCPRSRIVVERREDDVDDDRREPERRLVEKQQRGPGDERARDRELLLLSAREHRRQPVAELRAHREELVDSVEVVPPSPFRAPRREPELEVLLHRQSREEPPPSGTSATPLAGDRLGRAPADRPLADADSPPRAGRGPCRVQRRRLARAVRADEPHDLAGRDARETPRTAATPP